MGVTVRQVKRYLYRAMQRIDKARRRQQRLALGMAAGFLVAIAAALAVFLPGPQDSHLEKYFTRIGEQQKIELADGSVVTAVRVTDIDTALHGLEQLLPIEVTRHYDRIVITAVLVNGRRVAGLAGNENSFVNILNMPLSAVERVDIQLDGASTVYRSDAIGGVAWITVSTASPTRSEY